jgi:hypothetical protein
MPGSLPAAVLETVAADAGFNRTATWVIVVPVTLFSARPPGLRPPRAALLLLGLTGGCVALAQPRYTADVAAGIQSAPMRRLETNDIAVYYPQERRAEAERFAHWVGGCIRDLRGWAPIDNRLARRKPFVVMPEPALNNAFVMPPALGFETTSVVTSHSTFDFLVDVGMAPDPALFGCHEMVHWVQMMQIAGFWGFIDKAFGDVLTPQAGLDPWFHEGIATFYESRLQPGNGRMISPFWEGAFHAGVAGRRIDGGDLSFAKRTFAFGNHYLIGSRFVAFLVERYGEAKLWQLVHTQATSFFFPLWVSLRFWQVYDKNLSTLIDEFADDVARKYPVIERPADQRVVHTLGHSARYATSRNGTEAVINEGFDQPVRLDVYAANGQRLRHRSLAEVLPLRTLVEPSTTFASGLSLTADGGTVFFTVIDQGVTFLRVRLVRYRIASDQLDVLNDDLGGPGGSVSDDGSAFFFARAAGDRHDLAELDLRTGRIRTVVTAAPGVFLGAPRPSPDGAQLVATAADAGVVQLVVFDRATGHPVGAPLAVGDRAGGPSVEPWFADGHRILFSHDVAGRFQVFVYDLTTGASGPVTRAPYIALAARPWPGGQVRFLNRVGWQWTVDQVALPELPVPVLALAVAPVTPEAMPAPAPEPPPPAGDAILSDAPYSAFDRLFVPQLYALSLTALPSSSRSLWGATVGGGDRLGLHRWALSGYADVVKSDSRFGGSIGYANTQAAPLLVLLSASQFSWWDRPRGTSSTASDDIVYSVDRRQRDLGIDFALPFYTHAASLGLHATEQRRIGDPSVPRLRQLTGISAALTLINAETTPYVGQRRALELDLDGTVYPGRLGTQDFTFTDLRALLHTRWPVPPLSRLSLGLDLRGRALAGAPVGSHLLDLGGTSAIAPIVSQSSEPARNGIDRDLSTIPTGFFEPLRGYEDLGLAVDRAVIADGRLTYPIIIDHGFASSLVLLPSLLIRQLDLEAFGAAAWDTRTQTLESVHAAAGAALSLRTVFWVGPLSLRYQVARRLRDDNAWVHLLGIGS